MKHPKGSSAGKTDSTTPAAQPGAVAVAVRHDPTGAAAPQVVASGRGFVAEQILQLAFDHGVKVRQDSDLAQILAVLDIDSDIPPEAYAAVAEILVYVYRANAAAPPVAAATPLLKDSGGAGGAETGEAEGTPGRGAFSLEKRSEEQGLLGKQGLGTPALGTPALTAPASGSSPGVRPVTALVPQRTET